MAQRDMRNLVRDDARQLGLVFGGGQRARVDEDITAGQRKGVDLLGCDDGELVCEWIAGRFRRQPFAQSLYVRRYPFITQDGHLLCDLLCRSFAKLHVLLGREEIEPGLEMRGGSSTGSRPCLSATITEQ